MADEDKEGQNGNRGTEGYSGGEGEAGQGAEGVNIRECLEMLQGNAHLYYREALSPDAVVDLILLDLEGLGSRPDLERWLEADPPGEHPDLPELLADLSPPLG